MKAIMDFSKILYNGAEKEKKRGKLASFLAKEILYQTEILKKIEEDTSEIRRCLERRQERPAAEITQQEADKIGKIISERIQKSVCDNQ